METITLRAVTQENWRAAFHLAVRPEQVRFGPDYAPIAAIGLAKAYVRLGEVTWAPYVIYTGTEMAGFIELAYSPGSSDDYWIFHFLIDQRFQQRGYGTAALERMIELVKREHPQCQALQLVVHPENVGAQRLYIRAGFLPTGAERWGEPVYQLALRGA
jgi:diamine N-acetyltransferase